MGMCPRSFCDKAKEPYVQGQNPSPGIREYFFYVDHNGMLFQDDSKMKHWTAALKEKKLLFNFFKRLRFNESERYKEFQYISLCGKERNYVRCLDRPFVFTAVSQNDEHGWMLQYNNAGDMLQMKLQPEKILMVPETGRVYHPGNYSNKQDLSYLDFFHIYAPHRSKVMRRSWSCV